jgi:hypothetical protein
VRRELVHYPDGSLTLTDEDGEVEWSSDDDDAFLEEFDAFIDTDDMDAVIEYLEDEGYLEDGEQIDIVAPDEQGDEVPGEGVSLH